MSSPFNGTWKIDLGKSRVWNAENDSWVSPDPVGIEEVTIFITDELYDQVITVGVNPTLHMGYTAFWGGGWVPYMLRSLDYPPENSPEQPKVQLGVEGVPLEVGQPIAYLKMIYINERYHYRISRNVDGSPNYVMARRMHEGDNSYTATLLSPEGTVMLERYFDRA